MLKIHIVGNDVAVCRINRRGEVLSQLMLTAPHPEMARRQAKGLADMLGLAEVAPEVWVELGK